MLTPAVWIGPAILVSVLLAELLYVSGGSPFRNWSVVQVPPGEVAMCLLGPYLLGVELVSMLLLSALIGAYHLAYHLGRRRGVEERRSPIVIFPIPFEQAMMLAAILFCLGLAGVLVRRDAIFVLLSLEVMLNAAGLAFVVAGARWHQADGQVMFLFILAVAAAEVSLGLALVLWLYHWHKTVDIDRASSMRG